jgi:hypothetical protein
MRSLPLSAALAALFLVLACSGGGGGGLDADGACDICPNAQNVDTAACAAQGAEAGCESAELMEVTDDHCDLGQPSTLHPACVYKGCASDFNCDKIRTY